MFRHSTNTASFFCVLIAGLIFLLSLAGVAAAQGNTKLGEGALASNTTVFDASATPMTPRGSSSSCAKLLGAGFSSSFSDMRLQAINGRWLQCGYRVA